MNVRKRFGLGLRYARKRLGLTQEDFSTVSSRTYLSSLERGLNSPTIDKLEQLASVLGGHPLSLLAMAYIADHDGDREELCAQVFGGLTSDDWTLTTRLCSHGMAASRSNAARHGRMTSPELTA